MELNTDYRVMNIGGKEEVPETEVIVHGGHTHTVVSDHHDEEVLLNDMLITTASIRYGVTDQLMLSATLPHILLFTDEGNDDGFGDLVLAGTYSLLKHQGFNLAAIGGVELPTGQQKDASFDNTTVVIGSGSYDPMAGLTFSKKWEKIQLTGNGMYKFTTDGFDGNYYGDLCVQSLNVSYRLLGKNNCSPSDSIRDNSFSIVTGAGYYGEWLDKITEDDVVDDNSGYYLGYATLSTKLSWKQWSMPFVFSLPVIQNMNGNQHDAGLRFRTGLSFTF